MGKTEIKRDKLVYGEATLQDLSKTLMYEFHND